MQNNRIFTPENFIETTGLIIPSDATFTIDLQEDSCDITSNFRIEKTNGFVYRKFFEYQGIQCSAGSTTYAVSENYENSYKPAVSLLIHGQLLDGLNLDLFLKFNNESLNKQIKLNEKELAIYLQWKNIDPNSIDNIYVIVDFYYDNTSALKLTKMESEVKVNLKDNKNCNVSRILENVLSTNEMDQINMNSDIKDIVRKLKDLDIVEDMERY